MPFINDELVVKADVPIDIHIESAVADTALPAYPFPSLLNVKREIVRVLNTFTDENAQAEFQQALAALEPQLSATFEACVQGLRAESGFKGGNWATKRFKELLLSLPAPLSSSSCSLAFAIEKPAESSAESATILLRALADVYTSREALDAVGSDGGARRFETKQLSELFATVRRPGPETDTLASFSGSRHVVVWKAGRAYAVDILDEMGTPISAVWIKAQLRAILKPPALRVSRLR
jgi:hypothetical protein